MLHGTRDRDLPAPALKQLKQTRAAGGTGPHVHRERLAAWPVLPPLPQSFRGLTQGSPTSSLEAPLTVDAASPFPMILGPTSL